MDANYDYGSSGGSISSTIPTEMPISSSNSSSLGSSFSRSGIFQLLPGVHYNAPPVNLPVIVGGQINPNSFFGAYLTILRRLRNNEISRQRAFEEMMDLEVNIASAGVGTSSLEQRMDRCTRLIEIKSPVGVSNLSSLINREPQNSVVFRWLFCALNTSYLTVNKISEIQYNWNIDVQELQRLITVIGLLANNGFYGQLWSVALKGLERLAYIKSSKTTERDSIKHEFFIGYYLNDLRDLIPNFMYVYGMFSCNGNNCLGLPPLINENQPDYIPANYLIVEAIKPGYPSLHETIATYNTEQFMSVYLQIICAMGMAHQKFDFCHNDLHEGNILLQEVPNGQPVLIKYTLGETTIYIKSFVIAKIIDYGLAHIRIKDPQNHQMNFGNMISERIDFTQSTPIQDIYLVTGRLLLSLLQSKSPVLFQVHNIITDFIKFNRYDTLRQPGFNEGLFVDDIDSSDYFDFPGVFNPRDTDPFTHHLNHIRERYPYLIGSIIFDYQPRGTKVLICDKNHPCADIAEVTNITTSNIMI